MDEQSKKALDFAQDATKQLITLATGVVAISITFFKDFAASAPADAKTWMQWSWISYLLSIVFGVWTLLALTGALGAGESPGRPSHEKKGRPDGVQKPPSIYSRTVRLPAFLQAVTFLVALVLSVIAGWRAVT